MLGDFMILLASLRQPILCLLFPKFTSVTAQSIAELLEIWCEEKGRGNKGY